MSFSHEPAISWREQLHNLPHGEAPPDPLWLRFALFAVCAPFLALTSLFLAAMAGAAFGLSCGVGPEDTGGVAYILPGALFSIGIATLISLVAIYRGASHGLTRYLFYCISTPAWLTMVALIASIDYHALLQSIRHIYSPFQH